MATIKQHEALRVPNGWKDQDKALIGQLERIFDDIYKRFGRLGWDDLGEKLKDCIVTNVSYDAVNQTLTLTINGVTTDITKIATLDGNGKVPASQLPSYVDDVEEYADFAHFPTTGEADKIYVALDTGFTYRWSGSQYVRLNTYDEATQSASGLMSASDKTKLDGVETGANKYVLPTATSGAIGGVKIGYTESGKKYAVKLSNEQMYVEVPWIDADATTSAHGLMSASDKSKLNGIESGATANVVTDSLTDTSTTNALSANQGRVLRGLIANSNVYADTVDKLKDAVAEGDTATFVRVANSVMNALFGVNRQGMAICFDYSTGYIEIIAWDTYAVVYGCSLTKADNSVLDPWSSNDFLTKGGITWGAIAGR